MKGGGGEKLYAVSKIILSEETRKGKVRNGGDVNLSRGKKPRLPYWGRGGKKLKGRDGRGLEGCRIKAKKVIM